MFDGAQYKVVERSFLGGWEDDVWGGYMNSLTQAQARIESQIEFNKARRMDEKRKFYEVKP